MLKKTIVLGTIFCFIVTNLLCVIYRKPETLSFDEILKSAGVSADNLNHKHNPAIQRGMRIEGIVLKSGATVTIEHSSKPKIHNDTLLIVDRADETMVSRIIPTAEIQQVIIQRVSPLGTTLVNVGIGLGVTATVSGVSFLILLLTKESCPFIYSYNGDQYLFDGEPYGGAICEGLKRNDWCTLEHLVAVDGIYRLRIANEVDETQYTDELKLLVVDYPESVSVAFDKNGVIHTYQNPISPFYAVNLKKSNLLPFIEHDDWAFWHDNTEISADTSLGKTREDLLFEFPRPKNAKRAKILLNACTTLWGSQMIKRFLGLAGNKATDWYKTMENSATSKKQGETWMERAEMFRLKAMVQTENGWKQKEVFWGGGPFVSESRMYEIDISDVQGDTLRMRLNPPLNFWTINYIAVDYSDDVAVRTEEISSTTAVTSSGEDVRPLFTAVDKKYHTMPDIGNYADLTFTAPAKVSDMQRTVFAKVNGYYDIHLSTKNNKPDLKKLRSFRKNPEKAITYSLQEFKQWQEQVNQKLTAH